LMNNRTLGEINEGIFVFHAENEAQCSNEQTDWEWACRRAKVMKPLIHNGILIGTNGCHIADALQLAPFQCPEIDVIALHNYGGGEDVAANYSHTIVAQAQKYGKRAYIQEFGATGDNNSTKAIGLSQQIDGILSAHIPFMFWQMLHTDPVSTGLETWINCLAWEDVKNRSLAAAADSQGAFQWPELFSNESPEEVAVIDG